MEALGRCCEAWRHHQESPLRNPQAPSSLAPLWNDSRWAEMLGKSEHRCPGTQAPNSRCGRTTEGHDAECLVDEGLIRGKAQREEITTPPLLDEASEERPMRSPPQAGFSAPSPRVASGEGLVANDMGEAPLVEDDDPRTLPGRPPGEALGGGVAEVEDIEIGIAEPMSLLHGDSTTNRGRDTQRILDAANDLQMLRQLSQRLTDVVGDSRGSRG